MALTLSGLRTSVGRYRSHSEAVSVAVLAIVVSLVLGVAARRRVTPLAAEAGRLRAAETEVASFRAAFRSPAGEERIVVLPDSLMPSVARDVRISLTRDIAAKAERSGLNEVRVRFTPADSTTAPPKPELLGATAVIADYTLAIECSGGYSALLSFVNHLPPSVAVQRLQVERKKSGGAQYRLVLTVFETAGPNQHG